MLTGNIDLFFFLCAPSWLCSELRIDHVSFDDKVELSGGTAAPLPASYAGFSFIIF